jgi:hypothetical protein
MDCSGFWPAFINGLVAFGTLSAVIVALFGNWIRLTFFPPLLKVQLLNSEGEKISMRDSKTGQIVDEARYYHLVVSNDRRWFTATNTDVHLTQIDVPAPGGGYRVEWRADVPIQCRNQLFNPLRHDIGSPKDFDVCSVRKSGILQIHPIVPSNNPNDRTKRTVRCDSLISGAVH